jgi:predicted ATPase
MSNYLKSIKIIGLHNRFDIQQEFHPSIQVIFGENGSGKTTLIHTIANAINGDYRGFFELSFNNIEIIMDDGVTLKIRKEGRNHNDGSYNSLVVKSSKVRSRLVIPKNRSKYENEGHTWRRRGYKSLLPLAYFPAFRAIIEVWASQDENKSKYQLDSNREIEITQFARSIFGKFVPQLNYPSTFEIEQGLIHEMREVMLTVSQTDRDVLTRSFVDVFSCLSPLESERISEKPEEILKQIKSLSQEIKKYPLQEESILGVGVYTKLREILESVNFHNAGSEQVAAQVLKVYRDSLKEIVEIRKKAFAGIERYLNAVNDFFKDKKLVVEPQSTGYIDPIVKMRFDDGSSYKGLSNLSSGERQIATLIYVATQISQQKILLIDEPEISLHVDWQRKLLNKISEQSSDCQIITCTHSPVIGADYDDEYVTEINLTPTDKSFWKDDSTDEDDFTDFEETEEDFIEPDEDTIDDDPER